MFRVERPVSPVLIMMSSRLNEPHWCVWRHKDGQRVSLSKNCTISIKTSKRDFSSKVTWRRRRRGASYVVWLPVKQPDLTSSSCDLQHTKPDRERGGGYVNLNISTTDYRALMQTSTPCSAIRKTLVFIQHSGAQIQVACQSRVYC